MLFATIHSRKRYRVLSNPILARCPKNDLRAHKLLFLGNIIRKYGVQQYWQTSLLPTLKMYYTGPDHLSL